MTGTETKTPCVEICEYENTEKDVERVCGGCGRTAEEITEWSTATRERKRQIVKAAKARRTKES